MRLLCIQIERFRGIKSLNWNIGNDFVCLIGPGDSTKTTILDAIELALSPRWNVTFDDMDFYDSKIDQPLSIIVTIGDLPDDLKSDAKFGLSMRGWSQKKELHDEPQDGDELVLSIRLLVDKSLEPSWTIFNDRELEFKHIGAKDRECLGCMRLGEFFDRHFAWGRGSILSKLTEEGDSLAEMLAEANRAARAKLGNLGPDDLTNLRSAAKKVKIVGAKLGVASKGEYKPNLDIRAVSIGEGGLSLHDGNVPVRRAGLGSRRLIAIAMQRELAQTWGLALIDEIEHGLEPHRIRRVLQSLCEIIDSKKAINIMLTTHSPIVVQELKANQLHIVRSKEGITKVTPIPDMLQPIVRKNSEAFLARKILVCEGKTEIGFCRQLDKYWAKSGLSFGLAGIALANGGGEEASKTANAFACLGYEVALLGDSDKPLTPSQHALESIGVTVLLWSDRVSLEQRIAIDLPIKGVAEIVNLAMVHCGEQSVRDAVQNRLNNPQASLIGPPSEWFRLFPEQELRIAIGHTAKKVGWYKRVDISEALTCIVLSHLDEIKDSDLSNKITLLKKWLYGNE